MATTGQTTDAAGDPDRVASLVREADFVHLLGSRDGDALAGVGILGTALDGLDVPYQASMVSHSASAEARLDDQRLDVAVGLDVGDAVLQGNSAALAAYDVAQALETDPDPVLAIAGAVAGGVVPTGPAFDAGRELGVERRAGLGIPTGDVVEGLTFSGLVHARFSGDQDAATAFVDELALPDELDDQAHTKLASAVALEAGGHGSTPRTRDPLERFLAPLASSTIDGTDGSASVADRSETDEGGSRRNFESFETIEGHADVLDALATRDPGLGIAHVLGHADRDRALECWRNAGAATHRAVTELSLSEEDDIAFGSVEDVAPRPVARLVRDFESTAPTVLVASGDSVALATTDDDAASWLEAAFEKRLVAGGPTLATLETTDSASTVAERLREER